MNGLQERDERTYHALDQLRQLDQKWQDRLTLNNLRLTERYRKCEIDLRVVLAPAGRLDATEFVAVLKYGKAAGNGAGNLEGDPYWSVVGFPTGSSQLGEIECESTVGHFGRSNNQQPVLVKVV